MALSKLSRRTLLAGGPVAFLLAPILRKTEAHETGDTPRRFIAIFTPNGLNYTDAGPSGGVNSFTLGDYYAPLDPHRTDLIAMSRMHIGGVPYGSNSEMGHRSGGMGCLTCTPDENTGLATGPSVDQFIARKLFEQGIAPVLRAPVYGMATSGVSGYAHNFFEDAGEPVPIVNDPATAFASLFNDATPDEALQLIARKKSVLDVSYGECKSYLPSLPSEGKDLLDYHCERIRELEQSLQAYACTAPDAALGAVMGLDPSNPANYPAMTDFFWQFMEVIMLCDMTRVASFSFGNVATRVNMPWLDPPLLETVNTGETNMRDHHSHTHAGTRDTVGLFMTWYAQKVSELVTRLKTEQPSGGRLFDETTILLTSEYGSNPHNNTDCANFIIGNGGGAFATGRHLEFDNDASHAHAMMVSLIDAMGIEGVDQFGHPDGGSGPLDALYG